MDWASLTSCRELTMEHADEAVRSGESLRGLLARLSQIAGPEDGAPKTLMIIARLARGDVAWLEGEVTVEVSGNDEQTTLDLFNEQGWGIKERLAPQTHFKVPFDEFERAVEISAKRFAPLKPTVRPNKIVLSNANATVGASDKPPAVELDEKSIGTAPPPALGMPKEPEPFSLPPAAEPDPFADAKKDDSEPGFGAFLDEPHADPALAGAIVSPQKPKQDDATSVPVPVPTPLSPAKKPDGVHSRPTVRRMVAIKPEALRTGRKDPRREEDE